MMPHWDQLRKLAKASGLTWRECSPYHARIEGGENIVNIFRGKRGLTMQPDGEAGSRGYWTAEDAIKAAGKPKPKPKKALSGKPRTLPAHLMLLSNPSRVPPLKHESAGWAIPTGCGKCGGGPVIPLTGMCSDCTNGSESLW
jgi:hypothetical protein